MKAVDNTLGMKLMIATVVVFAAQDGISRHLAGEYNTLMVVMIRYWFFAAFVLVVTTRRAGGLGAAAATRRPVLQTLRGALLALEICVMVYAFTLIGLVQSLAIFGLFPLLVTALSGPVLGEQVGWRRMTAVLVGFAGLLIILRPGSGVFSPQALVAVASAVLFAVYSILTRYVGRDDDAMTSFFWTGTVGALVMTGVSAWSWEPMIARDWIWMGILCVTGALGHYLLIRTYEVAEASAVQPFVYLQLVLGSLVGITVFAETLRWNTLLGAALIVAAGIFAMWRERRLAD